MLKEPDSKEYCLVFLYLLISNSGTGTRFNIVNLNFCRADEI